VGKKWEYNGTVKQLFTDFKKDYDSVRREVLYNIFNEYDIIMKLVLLIKMYLNKTYSKVWIGKNLMHFLFRMVGNKEMLYCHCLSFLLQICH